MHEFIFLVKTFKVTNKIHLHTIKVHSFPPSEIAIVDSLNFDNLLNLFLNIYIHIKNMYLEKT